MANKKVYCQICGRQIISKSTEDNERTIGADYGIGRCLRLVNGFVCPKCTPDEIEWGKLVEGVEVYE